MLEKYISIEKRIKKSKEKEKRKNLIDLIKEVNEMLDKGLKYIYINAKELYKYREKMKIAEKIGFKIKRNDTDFYIVFNKKGIKKVVKIAKKLGVIYNERNKI